MHDLVIRGAKVVDGSGRPAFGADIAVTDGRIVEVGRVSERGTEELAADGLTVTPGFVDGHTHYDAQLFWDPMVKPSGWNGVTTAVIGNCGFTLAPSRADARELAVRNLERSEDIPAEAISLGVPWGFEDFASYLDVLDALPKAINIGAQIGHSALRTWAMGEKAFEAPASQDEIDTMCREVASAFEHGAIGFTSSRNAAHLTTDGAPVASRLAEWSEIEALVGTAGAYPGAMYEFATEPDARAEDPAVKRRYLARLLELAVRSQARLTFGIVPVLGRDEDEWRDLLALLDEADSYGARMVGQAHCRGMTIYNSFLTQLPFDRLPLWRELRAMSPERKLAALNDPALRARLIAEADTGSFAEGVGAEARPPDYEKLVVLQSPLPPNPSVAELARARGVSPVEVIIDLARADELRTFFVQYVGDTSAKTLGSIIRHPSTVMTFSDAGAHVGQIVDGGLQVFFLAHWVRVLQEFTLEEAVRMVTWEPARAWGLAGRGLIRPGFAADLNILDPESIGPRAPEIVADLPGGNIRLEQRAQGLHFTVVNGVVTMAAGESTGRDPGHLLRRRSTGSGRSA